MAVYLILGLSLVVLAVALTLFVKSYRLLRREKQQPSQKPRWPLEQTLWEVGQPLTDLRQDAHLSSPMLKRRGFLSRLALGLLGAVAARAAARGKTLTDAEGFLTSTGGTELSLNESSASQCHHTDGHTGHIDVPSEVGYADIAPRHMDYTDCPPPPPPHHDVPPYHDVPPPPPRRTPVHQDHGDLSAIPRSGGNEREG
ncbi:MAG: hypothetical protein WA738_15350 [Candidatus Angelobacter sp.]